MKRIYMCVCVYLHMLNIMITSINFIVLFYFVKLEIPQRLFWSVILLH